MLASQEGRRACGDTVPAGPLGSVQKLGLRGAEGPGDAVLTGTCRQCPGEKQSRGCRVTVIDVRGERVGARACACARVAALLAGPRAGRHVSAT